MSRLSRPPLREIVLSTLPTLAPAALALLPALLLATVTEMKDESYDWRQHLIVGVGFAFALISTLLFGPWRAASKSVLALGAAAAITLIYLIIRWMPYPSTLFVVAGAIVATGHRIALRPQGASAWTSALIGLLAIPAFWAVSKLQWWQKFSVEMIGPGGVLIFVGCTLVPVVLLARQERTLAPPRPASTGWIIDALVLLVMAAVLLRTNQLLLKEAVLHHWSVITAPAELLRQGGALLIDVPSQYGFLNTLVLAALPADNVFTGLFVLNSSLLWIAGAILYFTLRTWSRQYWWWIAAGIVAINASGLISGFAGTIGGPQPYPSVGAYRFFWVYVVFAHLLIQHGQTEPSSPKRLRRFILVGHLIWLAGTLWSVESAVYVTATWFPAATLYSLPSRNGGDKPGTRLMLLLLGAGRVVAAAGLLLLFTLGVIAAIYLMRWGQTPDWLAFGEYAGAFSNGFGALPIDSTGAVWTLLLIQASLLAIVTRMDWAQHRPSLALTSAAWGAFWSVSTYFISRSHENNITNLFPLLVLVIGALGHAVRPLEPADSAKTWIWLVTPPLVAAAGWIVLLNGPGLKSEWAAYSLDPHFAKLLPKPPAEATSILARSLAERPGAYNIIGYGMGDVAGNPEQDLHAANAWLPLISPPLLFPLEPQRRETYMHRFASTRVKEGWLIGPSQRDHSFDWLHNYLESYYDAELTLTENGWTAVYYRHK
ncbi:hypothetical protein MASR2M8_17740 [Opitutaceae bacterium]